MCLSVSIVVHNTPASQLETALDCVMRAGPEVVWLIDNGPDRSLSTFASYHPAIRYLHVENHGFGAGHNIAMKDAAAAPEGFHLVMNADVRWEGDVAGELVEFMKSRPDVGLAAPEIILPDGRKQWGARMLPTPFDVFARRFLPRALAGSRLDRYEMRDLSDVAELDAPYLLGCFMLFRNKALRQCGLFDERFFMYPEDIDLTRRIHEKWRTVRWNGLSVIHDHGAASRKNLRMLLIHAVNMAAYFNKWGWFADPFRRKVNARNTL